MLLFLLLLLLSALVCQRRHLTLGDSLVVVLIVLVIVGGKRLCVLAAVVGVVIRVRPERAPSRGVVFLQSWTTRSSLGLLLRMYPGEDQSKRQGTAVSRRLAGPRARRIVKNGPVWNTPPARHGARVLSSRASKPAAEQAAAAEQQQRGSNARAARGPHAIAIAATQAIYPPLIV